VDFPTAAVERELRAAELVSRLNVRAPAFYGRVDVDGRARLVLGRVAGNSMLRVLAQHPWQVLQLADWHLRIHAVQAWTFSASEQAYRSESSE
jgi:hypothetical protein